ncbi:MAG TPA: hypothetical protein DCZ03_03160 [Gammaproteobacteria bacterium]|nr:hypothetical protein [Gammaproteobacteria bacterium]
MSTKKPQDRTKISAATEPLRISSHALLAGRSKIIIEHEGENYELRRTSNGKLILTK